MQKTISFLLTVLLVTGCNQQKQTRVPEQDTGFTSYISAFTSGVISSGSNIRIILTGDVEGAVPGEAAGKNLFSFSPAIPGEAYWTDKRTLEFRPRKPLPSGTSYQAKFNLAGIRKVPDKFKTFPFSFQTLHQGLRLEINGLNSISEKDLTWQQITGTITTADKADPAAIASVLSARQEETSLTIIWDHQDDGVTHNFIVDSIHRFEKPDKVVFRYDGKPIGAPEKGEKSVAIPALSDFNLLNVKITQAPRQSIELFFSDPVSDEQSLTGLFYLKGGTPIRIERLGNLVKLFPENNLQGRQTLIIDKNVRNSLGYKLNQEYTRDLNFTSLKPAVAFLASGNILPSTDGLIVPFKAVNLKAVTLKVIRIYADNIPQFLQVNQFDGTEGLTRVGRLVLKKEIPLTADKPVDYSQWNVFSLDISSLINTEKGALYRLTLSFNHSQSLYPCQNEENDAQETIEAPVSADREFTRYDGPGGEYYYGDWDESWSYEDYDWRERDNPCSDSYYMFDHHSVSKNILASDLGIIAKSGTDNRLHVFITNLVDASLISGAEVSVYDYQHRLMEGGKTDNNGMVSFMLDRKPFLIMAGYNDQTGYLRIDDGSSLSVSMFDVGGMKTPAGIKGFLYGERGVWRPGDSLYLTFILEDKQHVLPENHPVMLELFTPENKLYLRKVRTSGLNGMYGYRLQTEGDAPTGNWLARVRVGGLQVTKTIKIETVKPNRLKIRLTFDKPYLSRGIQNLGNLEVTWMHGAIARNLKTDVTMTLSTLKTSFKGYEDYVFDDPSKRFYAEDEEIYDGKTDNEGKAVIRPDIHVGKDAPGRLQAAFKIRAFEPSGDFSEYRTTEIYSPFHSYVGIRIPKGPGWNGALYSNETNLIPVVCVDEEGNPLDKKLKIEIYSVSWRWWWDRDVTDNLSSYVRQRSRYLIHTATVTTRKGKAMYEMKFDKTLWGRKLIRVIDPESGHSCGQTFYMSYKGWWNDDSQDLPGGAEMLSFLTDKEHYDVGEEIKIHLPSFQEGKALISIETGSGILQEFWKNGGDPDSVVVLKATPEMSPNIYISVALIQPHKRDNDRPIRMYGIQPISVTDPGTHLDPVVDMPETLKPEETFTMKVKEKNGKKMTYTIAVVDEGLLDLTRFRTPDPWHQFYLKEALGIKTWDIYGYVLGAYTGEMAGLLSVGGDEYLDQEGKKNTNRFKPVVIFEGPFELEKGKTGTHKLTLPNYVGSVRTMVIASQAGAYGSTEVTTPVKKPLMVLTTLPRVASPAETITLPVTVFAMDEKVKQVTVKLTTSEMFSVTGPTQQHITFSGTGDQLVYFELKTADKTGEGKVTVSVSGAGENASATTQLMVRAPNPRITRVISGVADAGTSWSHAYHLPGMEGTNKAMLEVSSMPPLNLEERLDYLITYPHGCVEQITSSAFPQLYLDRLVNLSDEQKKDIQDHVTYAINKLRSFQLHSGGLSYWPGIADAASEWGTSYAGHFMLEAQSKGYTLPDGFLDSWISYQNRMANSWARAQRRNLWRSSQMIQVYRLYTLALAGHPALGAMNRLREQTDLPVPVKWRLAGAYLLAGKEEVARNLVRAITTEVDSYQGYAYTYGSPLRDEAMILEVLTMLKDDVRAKKILDVISDNLNSRRWFSTQTVAWTLVAAGKFVGENGTDKRLAFETMIDGKKEKVNSDVPVSRISIPVTTKEGEISVSNKGNNRLFANITVSGIPLHDSIPAQADNLTMEITYQDLNGNKINPTKLEQGTDFVAEVRIHHPGILDTYQDMALTQLFPSGWEIRNLRLDNNESAGKGGTFRYQDIRDDRVYTYFNLPVNATKIFRVYLNATYTGRFFLPAVTCEAMYDHSVMAVKPGFWVEVVPQK